MAKSTMNHSDFEFSLKQNFIYHTNPTPNCLGLRHPWLANFYFYLNLFKVQYYASHYAKKLDYPYYPNHFKRDSYDILKNTFDLGGHYEIKGLEHLATTPDSAVIIGNHMSSLETMVLPAIIMTFREMSFIIKDSLLKYPLIGTTLRRVDSIAVSRSNPRDDLKLILTTGVEQLHHGRSIVVFPQSTRSVDFDPLEFNTIGIKLARKAQVPVIPLALQTDFWQNGRWIKDFGKIDFSKMIRIEFGSPCVVSGNGNDAHHQVIDFITSRLYDWNSQRE